MPDYSKSKIYKIYSYENDEVYYGSTVETLSRRMTKHRSHFKRYKEDNSKYYYTSFKILDFESAKIELVEDFSCENKEQLLQREGYYIRNNNCVNKNIPDRTIKEYNATNKDKMKEYYKNNKDKMKEQNKEYYKNNKDKMKEQNKEYKEQNKDKIKEQNKEYRQRKKEQQLMLNEDTNINEF